MGFLGIYKAVYDYAPQSEGELAISEGDLLYVLEKSQDDDWWKAKKRAGGEDEDEPEGLIPNNYVEEAQPTGQARALFEYTRQTDEELSFSEDANLSVYDTSDPDWILVGLDGDFGFVPSNYIDMGDADEEEAAEEAEPEPAPRPPALPSRPPVDDTPSPALPPRDITPPEPASPAVPNPAAALAGVLAGRSAPRAVTPPPPVTLPPRPQYASDDASEDDPVSPPLPTRPRSQSTEQPSIPSPPLPQRTSTRDYEQDQLHSPSSQLTPGGFHMYNINEMVSIMGKRKKMPTTLGINLKTGNILIAPERAQDGPSQEWSADKMTHYSREGKHVFMELVRPSKSVDFHAGAKDTAEEIVAALGEMAGAVRAEGLREVIMAGSGHEHKKGVVLYDFMAQGDDEVTVGIGDDVIVIDDTKSEEWWQVRRLKNGKEGVVPSSYIEITGTIPAPPAPAAASSSSPSSSGAAGAIGGTGKSTVAQNRREEERLTREAVRQAMKDESRRQSEVGPGMRLPERNSSLSARDSSNSTGQQRSRRENGRAEGGSSKSSSTKSKPDPSKVRTWTDRSKSFSVEAQFLGLKDGKINLHKMNGVKIAVPIAKMSIEDLEYVERVTGISLDEDKPLSSMRKKASSSHQGPSSSGGRVGASVEPKKSDYDWFQFFLSCEIAVGLCERYAQAFIKDSMDESVLPDVDGGVLRALGLREGDIIKVMRFLDNKYGRTKKKQGGEDEAEGGLFSGPGGTLRNNTRRGRPAPTSQASDVVDAKAFSQQKSGDSDNKASPSPAAVSPVNAKAGGGKSSGGFDDDAWDVKPSKQPQPEAAPRAAEPSAAPAPAPAPAPVAAAAAKPLTAAMTGSMQDLSLLTQPLQPDKTAVAVAPASTPITPVAPAQAPQPTGATPSFFTAIAQQQTGLPAINGARQRPMAPQYTQGQPGLMPPPPARPLSAPQSAQPSAFGPPPLQPQMTGVVVGQVAPPGQSLNEITQARMQQQYAQQMQQMQAAATMQGFQPQGMMPMMTGMPPQPTGFGPNQFMMPPQPPMQSPFADPVRPNTFSPVQAQPTGFPVPFGAGQQFAPPPGAGVNSYLPPPLEPQRTGMPQQLQAQPTGMNFTQGFGNHGMPAAPGPQPPVPQPLMPQQTGPAPPVRFGVAEPSKLAPQPTGRRANLSAATPTNPFGF